MNLSIDLEHDGSPEQIERVIATYRLTLDEGRSPQYTDEQLRDWMSERCEHGRPTTTVCGCGTGDLDRMYCEDCI